MWERFARLVSQWKGSNTVNGRSRAWGGCQWNSSELLACDLLVLQWRRNGFIYLFVLISSMSCSVHRSVLMRKVTKYTEDTIPKRFWLDHCGASAGPQWGDNNVSRHSFPACPVYTRHYGNSYTQRQNQKREAYINKSDTFHERSISKT